MKLFKSLLVAPATLGLLAPVAVTANEINLNDISNYSKNNTELNSNSFDFISKQDSKLISGGEGLVDTSEDSFSSTTSASFGSTFYVGSVDSGADDGVTTFSYDFALDLNTSFTGEDSLDVAIIGGNASETAVDGYMGGDGTADALTLDGIAYTFPVGGLTVTAGDGVGVDDLNTGACAYSAFTDLLGDCGTGNVGGSADSAVAVSYDFGNGFTIAGGIGGGGISDTETVEDLEVAVIDAEDILAVVDINADGDELEQQVDEDDEDVVLTVTLDPTTTTGGEPLGLISDQDPSTVGLELAYTTDSFGVSAAYTDNDDASGDDAGTFYSFQAAFTPDAPYSVSAGMEFDDDDASTYFLGVTTEAGVGSLSVGLATQGMAADHADNLQYEAAYAYPVNDGMTITPGVFIAESADEDEFGVVVTTSFSF